MNSTKLALRIGGTIFGVMFLAQSWRLITHADVIVAGYSLPLWASAVVACVVGFMSGWMFCLASRCSAAPPK